MAPRKRKSRLSKSKTAAKDDKTLKIDDKCRAQEASAECTVDASTKDCSVSKTPCKKDGCSQATSDSASTPGRNYTSHFRPYPMATCSSPSLLDITVTYDYSTEVDARDSSAPAPTMQQLAQLFTVKGRSKSTSDPLSVLSELSPAHSAPPTKRVKLSAARRKTPSQSSKLDLLLTQLQQRVTDATELREDATFNSELSPTHCQAKCVYDSECEVASHGRGVEDGISHGRGVEDGASHGRGVEDGVSHGRGVEDGVSHGRGVEDGLSHGRGVDWDTPESSDDEVQFWTQAVTQLDYIGNYRSSPQSEGDTGDMCHPWGANSEADNFIDQLLMTGAEEDDPLDIHTLAEHDCHSISTAQDTNADCCYGDNTSTPPLPHHSQHFAPASKRSYHCKSPRRPLASQLALEDARSTPSISPELNSRDMNIPFDRNVLCADEQVPGLKNEVLTTTLTKECLCSQAQIEHKRNLALLKLAKKKTLHNNH